jgi:hypothetical protein
VVTTNGATVEKTSTPATGSDNQAQTKARASLDEKMPATPAAAPTMAPAQNQSRMGFQPIEAPPLPISSTKEAQLQALLEKYKANQITPEQYQTQRAKILAEP